jgi:uncharacterized protein HemX
MKSKQPTKKIHWFGWTVILIIIALGAAAVYFYYTPATIIEVQREVVEKIVEKEVSWEEQLAIATEKKNQEIAKLEDERTRAQEARAQKIAAIEAEYAAQESTIEERLEQIRAVELGL